MNGPPDFAHAQNRRQKVRSVGLDPNYWYAVEHEHAIKPERPYEVVFWGRSVVLYRDRRGGLHAIDNRCAHRQVKLSLGTVADGKIMCPYHGWTYDGDGRLVHVPHDLFGRSLPHCRLASYATRVRYGLVWIFFGDRERASHVPMPEIPELEGDEPWACAPCDFTWNAHHSMIIDNVSDFTHAWLHREYRPFSDAVLQKLETEGDEVRMTYSARIGRGRISSLFVDHRNIDTNRIELGYRYPYQWSNTGNHIKHWCFVLPIDERTTRAFFLFYFKTFKFPFVPVRLPHRMMCLFLFFGSRLHIQPLLKQDGFAVEAEQRGWERHYQAPIVELNPVVHACQAITIRKWEEHLERSRERAGSDRLVSLAER
jgi:phenylpropionate dioxygenase-like ring-hydroxylating dioxygenase large terminal subunit